jgi:hypothetical protein
MQIPIQVNIHMTYPILIQSLPIATHGHNCLVFIYTRQIYSYLATGKDYISIGYSACALIYRVYMLESWIEGVRLAYRMDQDPLYHRSWTKLKIKMEILRALEIDKDIYCLEYA